MGNDRRKDILDAFIRLVNHFGIDKTTMQDIAKEVGVSVGVIYLDYKNKDELIGAYIKQLSKQIFCSCEEILLKENISAKQLLHEVVITFFTNVGEKFGYDLGFRQFMKGKDFFKFVRKNMSKEEFYEKQLVNLIEKVMERGVRQGEFGIDDPHQTAMLYIRAYESFLSSLSLMQPLDEIMPDIERMFVFLGKALVKSSSD